MAAETHDAETLQVEITMLREQLSEALAAINQNAGLYQAAQTEVDRLNSLLNTPEIIDFTKAVQLEAAHQSQRWGSEHDSGKTDADWFWLIGYLAGKALHNPDDYDGCACPRSATTHKPMHRRACEDEKRLHRIITVAAAAANWHAAKLGKTNMRPGIEPPASDCKDIQCHGRIGKSDIRCTNLSDPRWFVHVNGKVLPACDGCGCAPGSPCAGCSAPREDA